jgi:hypothetical protein
VQHAGELTPPLTKGRMQVLRWVRNCISQVLRHAPAQGPERAHSPCKVSETFSVVLAIFGHGHCAFSDWLEHWQRARQNVSVIMQPCPCLTTRALGIQVKFETYNYSCASACFLFACPAATDVHLQHQLLK